MLDSINSDSTLDLHCPVCDKFLPRRGTKGNVVGVHTYVCPYCSEEFDVVIEDPEE